MTGGLKRAVSAGFKSGHRGDMDMENCGVNKR
jgi:hypothetical protein